MRKSARICRIYGLSINGFQIRTDHLQKYLDPWQIHFCTNQRKIRRLCGFKDVKEFVKIRAQLTKKRWIYGASLHNASLHCNCSGAV
jgi:hypothetical protein